MSTAICGRPAPPARWRRHDDPALPYAPLCDGPSFSAQSRGREVQRSGASDAILARPCVGRGGNHRLRKARILLPIISPRKDGDPGIDRAEARLRIRIGPYPHCWRPPGWTTVVPADLGIDLTEPASSLVAGQWYPVSGLSGVYVSFLQPKAISAGILASHRDVVNSLDAVEAGALDYLVAFDLAEFDLGFVLGTDHPRVGWSDRAATGSRGNLPGPDGIGTAAPLVTNGMISPALAARDGCHVRRRLQAPARCFRLWRRSPSSNHGSHYGFIEQGDGVQQAAARPRDAVCAR